MSEQVQVKVDDAGLRDLMKLLRKESDGKKLRGDLVKEIRTAVAPGVSAVQAKLRAIPHDSAVRSSPALRAYLASRVKSQVKLSGHSSGVKIRIGQTPALRGFKMAARRLNAKSWRHPVYARQGRETTWVTQVSPMPGYFDETLAEHRAEYRAAVVRALEGLADRLTARRFGGK